MTAGSPLRLVPLLLALAGGTSAQIATGPEHDWSRGTTLNVFAGAAADTSAATPLAGAAVGWELTPWITIEGNGAWLRREGPINVFMASVGPHVNLTRPAAAVPFVKGGIGLYRASIDRSRGDVPAFYAHRMGAPDARTFTDPALLVGGGVNVYVTTHWAIRPQIEALVVRRDARQSTAALVTVHVPYHFERHSPRARTGRRPFQWSRTQP